MYLRCVTKWAKLKKYIFVVLHPKHINCYLTYNYSYHKKETSTKTLFSKMDIESACLLFKLPALNELWDDCKNKYEKSVKCGC